MLSLYTIEVLEKNADGKPSAGLTAMADSYRRYYDFIEAEKAAILRSFPIGTKVVIDGKASGFKNSITGTVTGSDVLDCKARFFPRIKVKNDKTGKERLYWVSCIS